MRILHWAKGEPHIWWHWQNLDEDRDGRKKGRGWRHGRAWLHLGSSDEGNHNCIGLEWVFPGTHWAASITVRGEDDLALALTCGLFGFYLNVEHFPGLQAKGWRDEREIRFSLFGRGLHWSLWNHPGEWSSKTPAWRHGSFAPLDSLLGHTRYSKHVLQTAEGVVNMPERAYPVTVTLFESIWKRVRWPWPTLIMQAEIECENGIPVPGKGENSWDCGEDAIYSLTTPAQSLQEALATMTANVQQARLRYGGPNWTPTRK